MDSARFRSISCAKLYVSYNGTKDKLLLGPFGIVLRSIQAFFYGTLTIECATTSPEDGALAINIARETT